MTEEEKVVCGRIIHSAAVIAAAGNLAPVPGTGVACDILAMTTMTMTLASYFGQSIPEEVAKGMAIAAIKETMLKQPIKVLAKELSKLIPGLGQIVAPSISVVMLEAAGWSIAEDLDRKRKLV